MCSCKLLYMSHVIQVSYHGSLLPWKAGLSVLLLTSTPTMQLLQQRVKRLVSA
jgi:hypothetical protein